MSCRPARTLSEPAYEAGAILMREWVPATKVSQPGLRAHDAAQRSGEPSLLVTALADCVANEERTKRSLNVLSQREKERSGTGAAALLRNQLALPLDVNPL